MTTPPNSFSPGWVVTLDGAAHLKAEDTDRISSYVVAELQRLHAAGKEWLHTLIACENDLAAAVKEDEGVYTVFIGRGLEVIQAVEK